MEREWSLRRPPPYFESFNVAPGRDVPVVRSTAEGRVCDLMRWPMIPRWAKGQPVKFSTSNARAETMKEKTTYRGPWQRGQRCLLPVIGFYEWQVIEGQKQKQPWFIHLADRETFALSGLWESVFEPQLDEIVL